MARPLQAAWFDGRTSGSRPVLVRLSPAGAGLALLDPRSGRTVLELDHSEVEWPDRWSTKARSTLAVGLRHHGSLQLDDPAAWQTASDAAGRRPGLVERMQTRWGTLLVVLLVAVAALGAFYRWGTPWAAVQLTRHVPLEWEQGLSAQALIDLDARWLKPSKLSQQRQEELRARFDTLAASIPRTARPLPGYRPALRLLFRNGMDANAFALPGGTVVLTDGMVEVAAREQLTDDALVGVLAHEIGHVLSRHTTRMLVEQAVLNVGLGVALGDVSTLLSSGASLLTGLAYRRGHEAEADCMAVALLRQAGVPPQPMAALLLAAERREGEAASAPSAGWTALLRTHPATPERARHLAAGGAAECRGG